MPTTSTIIGIDLGTTNTNAAVVVGGRAKVVPVPGGGRAIPSVVWFPRRGGVVVGAEARAQLTTDPTRTVASPKRLLGRRHADREVQSCLGQAPYRSAAADDGGVILEIDGERWSITQVCAELLGAAKAAAEAQLGAPVTEAVIAVPMSFDQRRCHAVEVAAQLAGLEVAALIAEPNAAALANRYVPGFGGLVGIHDFGGGTFDFSLVDVSRSRFQVVAAAGDAWLGGDDIDAVLADAAANQFWRQHRVDLRHQAVEMLRLRFACEEVKRTLSRAASARLHVPAVMRSASGMIDLDLTIDRATLARVSAAIVGRTLDVCDRALAEARIAPDDLTAIYLCGGSAQMPVVRDAVARHFRVPARAGIAPDHAVCLGAAIHGSLIARTRALKRRAAPAPRLASSG